MEKLVETLKNDLRKGLCAEVYVRGLLEFATDDHFEIRGFDTIDGVPRTNRFSDFGIKI